MQQSFVGRMIDRPEFGPFVLLVLLVVVFTAINRPSSRWPMWATSSPSRLSWG